MHTEDRFAVLNWINISVHYYNHYTLYTSLKFISIEFIKQSVCVITHYWAVFVLLKSFFNFFRFQLSKSHLPFPIWCGKRDNHFSRRNGKGVRLMKPSDFQKTVQCRFESCLKKVVRHVVKDYQKKLKRRKKEETLFCELPEIVVENLAVWDDYDTDYTIFNVCGSDIRICDDELAEALKHLSERNRENLLMYYFLEMSDTEIAKRQNISRSGVFQNRHNSLELMKKILKEK